jgi:DNA-directed RNA polymerase subunit E'
MYRIITISDIVRIPPSYFTMDLNTAVQQIVQEKYERKVDVEQGVILKILNVRDVSGGKIIPGDGAAYYDVKYDALVFIPEMHEVLDGEITEVLDFGVFVNIGPFDGLVHLSQITNDFLTYERKSGTLTSKGTKKILKKGDFVRAKVVTVSLKPTLPETKIALTMKDTGLGKLEWLEESEEKKAKKAQAVKEVKKEEGKAGKSKKEKKEEKK